MRPTAAQKRRHKTAPYPIRSRILQPAKDDVIVLPELDEGTDPTWRELERLQRGGRIRGHAI